MSDDVNVSKGSVGYLTIPTLNRSKPKIYNHKTKIYNANHITNYLYSRPIVPSTITSNQWNNRGSAEDREKSICESLNRTKGKIIDYALSNHWEWFLTFTLDPNRVDRFDYNAVSKKMSNWFDLTRKRKAPNLKYMIVPEQHKNGAWHFHAIISNIGTLEFVDSGKKDNNSNPIYNLKDYRLGFTTATKVIDSQRVSYYLSKYITKDLVQATFNKKRYWISKNLSIPKTYKIFVEQDEYIEVLSDSINKSEHYKLVELKDKKTNMEIQSIHITNHNNLHTLPKIVKDAIEIFGVNNVNIKNIL